LMGVRAKPICLSACLPAFIENGDGSARSNLGLCFGSSIRRRRTFYNNHTIPRTVMKERRRSAEQEQCVLIHGFSDYNMPSLFVMSRPFWSNRPHPFYPDGDMVHYVHEKTDPCFGLWGTTDQGTSPIQCRPAPFKGYPI